ncbi:universal stress protein [Rhodococcus phenolicus]|uniref:universal stress protein n=1 Tax=Rhodococcus phenolicus TaxID=263849 RepID=UPI0008323405|nr:universal stress protein [Rhodococcus phenolicus]
MTVAVVHAETPEGRAALVAAVDEAARRHENLLVLHVLDDDGPAAAAEAESVRTAVRRIAGDGDWEVRSAVHDGDPVGTLVELVVDSGADRVVVGSRGRNALGKFLLERPLQRLLIEVPVPVLVVKDPEDR